ncbi:MAG: multicopper oxidase domain-containing protein [Gemmatimonadetes bacterium]|nr:multicopper oxidase family protein [Gemmatimonadota bacterium]NIU80559.1 multicopper oxidase domain-containing protein [Gammaproteobacteria bacterium]NIX48876.1 multicopper oxidase domain-containing protein [Gemmatimonadota bacterium]NIY13319.1 multicopper oxidase domain-containing protein [Gemmatimonadota bacterium]
MLEDQSSEPGVVEVTLTATATRLSLTPGSETDVFAYNGHVPGPTLEVREGDRVIVHLRNELPDETTVHWHGLHIPWVADGSPFHPLQPGEEVDLEFTIPEGTAGTYWYHPHPDHRTGYQVAKGLYGAFIVRAREDPLPEMTEQLIILSDNRFLDDGTVDVQDRTTPRGRIDFENGREGDVLFVNGQVMPTIRIRSGEVQRWRIVNASGARVYRLAIPGHELLHVGSDGGLFEKPVARDEILIANSERVEVLVRGTAPPGSRAVLQDLPYDRYIPQTRPGEWETTRELLTLAYSDEPPVEPVALPDSLRHVPPLDPADATATRVMVLTQGFINGKTMDMDRVDETAALGATEIWQVENLVGMDHPFHLHGFRFQVLSRDGEPVEYRSWKDTVNVPKHGTVRFIVRFDDYPGKWMFHCHILDHEDHGMMGILEVR